MNDRRWEVDERDVRHALSLAAGESRVYREHLALVRVAIERLAEDTDDPKVSQLRASVVAALEGPPGLGTPRHIEEHALRVLDELPDKPRGEADEPRGGDDATGC